MAALILVVAAFENDFSIAYIFHHSNRDLTAPYKFAVLWSGQEGSLLFWSLLLSGYGLVLRLRYLRELVTVIQKEGHYERPDVGILEKTRAPAEAGSTYILLMDGIREELFQIEVEHKQGHISQAEYEKARAALDQTLDRALQRKAQRP